jgi:hypothetical protein
MYIVLICKKKIGRTTGEKKSKLLGKEEDTLPKSQSKLIEVGLRTHLEIDTTAFVSCSLKQPYLPSFRASYGILQLAPSLALL